MNTTSIFQYQSSPVDWCEANYPIHANIVEFFNTLSNLAFVILPIVFVWLHGSFRRYIDSFIPIAFMTQFFVGLGSAYFHATLSLFGQYLDELAIFYTMITMWLIWGHLWLIYIFPRQARPLFYHADSTPRRWLTLFRVIILACMLGITIGCFFTPSANMYGLNVIGALTISLFATGVIRSSCGELQRLGIHVVLNYIFAVLLWCTGRFLCPVWSDLGIGFIWHALWHVFICWATLNAFVVLAHHIACVKIAMGTTHCARAALVGSLPHPTDDVAVLQSSSPPEGRHMNKTIVGVRLMFWPHCLPDKTGWQKLTWLVRIPHVEPIFAVGDVQVENSHIVQIMPDTCAVSNNVVTTRSIVTSGNFDRIDMCDDDQEDALTTESLKSEQIHVSQSAQSSKLKPPTKLTASGSNNTLISSLFPPGSNATTRPNSEAGRRGG